MADFHVFPLCPTIGKSGNILFLCGKVKTREYLACVLFVALGKASAS
jgi:hypothetical protein